MSSVVWGFVWIVCFIQSNRVTSSSQSLFAERTTTEPPRPPPPSPPRNLNLTIACEPIRPCILATWLPPKESLEGKSTLDRMPGTGNTWNTLVAYRVRYQLVAATDPAQDPEEQAPFTRMVEKNVTRLQFSTTAGEHLFGVGYEVRVAAIGEQGMSPEISARILIPEAAPSDAPTDFRVVSGDEVSVHLGWKPPRFQYRNGKITHYQVRCYVLGAEESTEKLQLVTGTEVVMADLPPATHACLVRAGTKLGPGPWTNRVLFRIHGAAPPSPIELRAFRLKPSSIRLEWTVPNSGLDVVRFNVYYKAGKDTTSSMSQWDRHVTESDALHTTLLNLDPEQIYLVKVSSVDSKGRESAPSASIVVHPATKREPTSQLSSHGRVQPDSRRLRLTHSNPSYFAVRNLKCTSKTSNSLGLEWLAPVESKDILEYEITLTGRKEFITNNGVLKAVHLGDRHIRQTPLPSARLSSWHLEQPQSMPVPDEHLKFLQITELEPYSRYDITVRPHYHLRSTQTGTDQANGGAVKITCHTDWAKPELVKIPELEAIHKAPDKSSTSGTLLELRIYRVSEQNGPLHEYLLLTVPYDCADATASASVNFDQPAEQLSLKMLSNTPLSAGGANSPIPYLALQVSPTDLFKPNENSAIVILGNELNLRTLRAVGQATDHVTAAAVTENVSSRSIRAGVYDVKFGSTAESDLHVFNKAIDTTCKYRVALTVCSKYLDGRRLCTTSGWSIPIDPRSSDVFASAQASGGTWRNASSSKFTTIVIGLTCGLVFFALLSLILGCVLRYRKRQLTERHILGSATQWDAQICGDVTKSIHADDVDGGSGGGGRKMTGLLFNCENRKRVKSAPRNVQPFALFYSLSSSGMQSPSNSSLGMHALRPIYPSAGGLASALPGRSHTSHSLRSTESPGQSTACAELISPLYSPSEVPCTVPIIEASVSPTCVNARQTMYHCKHANGLRKKPSVAEKDSTAEVGNISPTSPKVSTDLTFVFRGRLPITVHALFESIHQNAVEWTRQMEEEFHEVDGTAAGRTAYLSTVHGSMEQNRTKNRSQACIPFDHNRVPLMHQYGTAKTDYINASFIDGYRKANAYIATQVPLPETFEDFWSMVWEQKCGTIVLLNQFHGGQHQQQQQLDEEDRCDRFWPITGSEHYGTVSVTNVETTDLAYYVLRKFLIQSAQEQRTLWQLQYTHWSDQGSPKLSTPFLTFVRRVGAIASTSCGGGGGGGPTVVMCARGAERTGLFIAVDILLEQAKHEGSVDIPGLVTRLRAQRMHMIRTAAQYHFLYQATMESILDGNTEVAARHFFTHIQQLDVIQTGNVDSVHVLTCVKSTQLSSSVGLTGFQLEFRKIHAYAPTVNTGQSRSLVKNGRMMLPDSCFSNVLTNLNSSAVALSTVNVTKNRLLNVVPFDSNRVTLCPIRGVEGSDYINASFVDGYEDQGAYIACQAPMASTVEDFWRMIWEQRCQIIVMLCELKEGGKEQCCQYWPSIKPSRYQFFVIDLTAEYNMAGHILREFKITDARDGESRTVRHLQYTRWPERGVPTSGDSLIDLIGQVQKMRALSKDRTPITVHCSSGTGRTGVFIALSNVFERLRQESVVDMYATVKLLRQQRVSLVQTEEQYRFCYLATLDYLTSFDLYTQPLVLHPASPQPRQVPG